MALFDPKARAISQLQKSIDEKTASINRYFDEIGRLYYGQYRDEQADVSKDINSRCDAITALYLDIEAHKLKILFEKGLKLCANCKAENPLAHAYCSTCGTKFPEGSDKQVEVPAGLATTTVAETEETVTEAVTPESKEETAASVIELAPVEAVMEVTTEETEKAAKKPAKKSTKSAEKNSGKGSSKGNKE